MKCAFQFSDFDSGPPAINTGSDSRREEVSCFSPFVFCPPKSFPQLDVAALLKRIFHLNKGNDECRKTFNYLIKSTDPQQQWLFLLVKKNVLLQKLVSP